MVVTIEKAHALAILDNSSSRFQETVSAGRPNLFLFFLFRNVEIIMAALSAI